MGKLTTNTAILTLLLTFFAAPALAKTPQAKSLQANTPHAEATSVKSASRATAEAVPYWKAVVANVAEQAITREDLLHIIQIEQAYGLPMSESSALMTVMKDLIAQEIARSVGVEITATEIPTHFPIIDQHTPSESRQLQDTLPANKQPFHVDHASYAKLYVVPKMLDRKFRKFYDTASDLHPAEQQHIEQALELALSGKSFSDAARETGTTATQYELADMEIELAIGLEQKLPAKRNLLENPLLSELYQLSQGKILPKILEDESSFRVIRLMKRNGSIYNIEAIEVGKPPFDTWLKNRALSLSIEISDDQLQRAVKAGYPNIDWVSRLQ